MAAQTLGSVVGARGTEGGFRFSVLAGVLVGALCVLVAFVIEGGDLSSLILPSPILIIFGGTLGALLIAHGGGGVAGIPGYVGRAFGGGTSAEGARVMRNAGTFALLASLLALLLAAIVILSGAGTASPGALGHAVAVALISPLYGVTLTIVCWAFSHNLRGPAV